MHLLFSHVLHSCSGLMLCLPKIKILFRIEKNSALKNENLLKMYLPLGKTRCRNLALRHLFTQNASLRLKTQDTALRSVFFFLVQLRMRGSRDALLRRDVITTVMEK